ncbi:unnamed protein product [Candidula unifasciata]|uniref:Hexosyltransferase n=1 Tax=Candidula unifasciata TaxID=100452 RepID=A0A8S3Z560_9EUPU|nr:unnamed protein product [Candidula unifasciata]
MRRIAVRWSTGKQKLVIMFAVNVVCFFLAHFTLSSLHLIGHRRTFPLRSQRSAPSGSTPDPKKTPEDMQLTTSEVSKHVNTTKARLFKNSACVSNQFFNDTTRCSSCLRPGAGKIEFLRTPVEHLNPANYTGYFKPASGVVQNLITDYLITPSLDCPYLLAVQASVKDRPHERDLVRRTWGSVAETQTWPNRTINAKIKILFVVAHINKTEQENQRNHTLQFAELVSEARLHNDILYIDMIDNYQNLTLKLVSAFKWVKDNCPCVTFVLKVDFDTFVNVPLLVDFLLLHQDEFVFSVLGVVYKNAVRRWGRWRVPKSVYPMQNYPFYASGCAYVLSMKVISQVVDTAPHYRILPIEDAFITGILRLVIGYQLVNVPTAFTHYTDNKWHHCQLLNDTKALAVSRQGYKHKRVWKSFLESSCR